MKNIRTLAASLVVSAAAFCGYATDYYVDSVNGNDANSGLAPGEGNAMESFAALFAKYTISSGSVVHAAPGIYSNGVMSATSGNYQGGYRVIVPAGVTIIGDSALNTVIKGAAAEGVNLDSDPFGCGTGAIRCVRLLGTGSTVKNFTLTDGHSTAYNGTTYVGAVCGLDAATYVIGCIITNNVGGRGAGVYKSAAIRCFFDNNRASTTGCDVQEGKAFNCMFGNLQNTSTYNVYGGSQYAYVNNTFYGTGYCTHAPNGGARTLYNSIVLKDPTGANTHYTNCAVRTYYGTRGGGTLAFTSEASVQLDGRRCPLRDSPCVDAGESSYYDDNFPAALIGDKGFDYLKNIRVVGNAIDIGACESPCTPGVAFDWYVDAVNGSDANDGTAAAKAHRTLAMATTNANLRTGDVIHAAAGVYVDGEVVDGGRKFRAVVPAGVMLLGASAATTVIEGAEDYVNGTAETYWCGLDALSCVKLNLNSIVSGFTLTKGHTPDMSSQNGGAVYAVLDKDVADKRSYVVDCVLTNNFAYRGGGMIGGTAVRCLLENEVASTGADIFQGRAWCCIFGDAPNHANTTGYNVYQGGPYVNCTFRGTGTASNQPGDSYATNVWNSVLLKGAGRHVTLMNSVTSVSSTLGEGSVLLTEEEMALDENGVPRKGSPLVDRGSSSIYSEFTSGVDDALTNKDFGNGQRIYNGRIDVGAHEYDWRNDFAKTLKRSQVSVVSAGESVVTNGVKALSVPSGAAVEIDWGVELNGPHTFYAASSGAGSVLVTCDGDVLAPTAEGKYVFIAMKGETRHIVVACTDGASAVLSDFRDPRGFIIAFR